MVTVPVTWSLEPSAERENGGRSADRLILWPLLFAIGGPIVIVLLRASPVGSNFLYVMLGLPLLLMLWAIAAIFSSAIVVSAAISHLWLRGISAVVLPAVVLTALPQPLTFIHLCNRLGDVVHFRLMRQYYMSAVNELPETGEPRLAVFNRGGMIWASIGVVYDESDEIALPPDQQSTAWKARAAVTELSCGYTARSMGEHFYVAEFPC